MKRRGRITFLKPPDLSLFARENELKAAGGLASPIPPAFASTNERPIRDAFVFAMQRDLERMVLPPDERIAFDIIHRGFAISGHRSMVTELVETRWDDEFIDEMYEHVWDRPIELRYVR